MARGSIGSGVVEKGVDDAVTAACFPWWCLRRLVEAAAEACVVDVDDAEVAIVTAEAAAAGAGAAEGAGARGAGPLVVPAAKDRSEGVSVTLGGRPAMSIMTPLRPRE